EHSIGCHAKPELGDPGAVDAQPALGDEPLARPAGAEAGAGKHLLQAHPLRIVHGPHGSSPASAASSSRGGRNGASGGRSASEVRPMRSRKYVVVPSSTAPLSSSLPTSANSPRVSRVR